MTVISVSTTATVIIKEKRMSFGHGQQCIKKVYHQLSSKRERILSVVEVVSIDRSISIYLSISYQFVFTLRSRGILLIYYIMRSISISSMV